MFRHRPAKSAGRATVRVSLLGSALFGFAPLVSTALGIIGFLATPAHGSGSEEMRLTAFRPAQESTIPDGSDIDGSTMIVSLGAKATIVQWCCGARCCCGRRRSGVADCLDMLKSRCCGRVFSLLPGSRR